MSDTEAELDDRLETLAERRVRQAVEGKKAMADYRAGRAAVDRRTAQLKALRLETAGRGEEKKGGGTKARRRTGQEIADGGGLFSAGPPVKFRIGI
ncbi:MAG: hypothetical protein ABI399_07925 [Bauldia sp.]